MHWLFFGKYCKMVTQNLGKMKGFRENWIGYLIVFALTLVGNFIILKMNMKNQDAKDLINTIEILKMSKADIPYVNQQDQTLLDKQKEDKIEILNAIKTLDEKQERSTDRIILILKNKN